MLARLVAHGETPPGIADEQAFDHDGDRTGHMHPERQRVGEHHERQCDEQLERVIVQALEGVVADPAQAKAERGPAEDFAQEEPGEARRVRRDLQHLVRTLEARR